jgi:hypothetical chaperone protein
MRTWYADPRHHERLTTVLTQRLGHALAAAAEAAKIEVAQRSATAIDLDAVEAGLASALDAQGAAAALEQDQAQIAAAAAETLRQAGVEAGAVGALYFTGGSTGLASLVDRIAAQFPAARRVQGDRFASVAQGLGLHARAVFAG